ncbi:hypothetical protein BV20DRAFT_962349 [Pilatotrama ljubarskyi]|nr:hypothetical protein BV20DRAFT_962349 [Pilatotrama ljubarskyi]
MTAQAPQLPPAVGNPLPTTPLSAPAAAHGLPERKHPRKNKKAKSGHDEGGACIANPVKMFDRIVVHPVAWPAEALRWMGVPHRLPVTPPITPRPLPKAFMAAALRQTYDHVADTLKSGRKASREDLANLVLEAFVSAAEVQKVNVYRRAKAYLSLGDMRVRLEPLHGFSGSGVAPVLAYVDEPHRRQQHAKLFCVHATRSECEHAQQKDDDVAVIDVAMLLAFAQEHKRWGVPPDADGNHTTRVMHPNEQGNAMIMLTAVTPAETLVGLREGHDMLKRIGFTRRTINIFSTADAGEWESSPLLQLVWSLVEEAGKLAAKTPAPRWPIGPWAWTAHF